jgi:hypothetical protein
MLPGPQVTFYRLILIHSKWHGDLNIVGIQQVLSKDLGIILPLKSIYFFSGEFYFESPFLIKIKTLEILFKDH